MAGTDSMETMMRMSALQPMSQDTISILDSAGSRGNSTIRRPVGVRPPGGNSVAASNAQLPTKPHTHTHTLFIFDYFVIKQMLLSEATCLAVTYLFSLKLGSNIYFGNIFSHMFQSFLCIII